jgi:hypothetical protein
VVPLLAAAVAAALYRGLQNNIICSKEHISTLRTIMCQLLRSRCLQSMNIQLAAWQHSMAEQGPLLTSCCLADAACLQSLCYYLRYPVRHLADSVLWQAMLLKQGKQWRVRLVLCQVFSHRAEQCIPR